MKGLYKITYGKKLMDSMNSNLEYLLKDIEDIENKEILITAIQSNLHRIVEIELDNIAPREIINDYVNLVFLTFHA